MKVNANRGIIWKLVQGAQSKPVGEPIFHPQRASQVFLVWFLITGEGGEDYHPNSGGTSPISIFIYNNPNHTV